MQNNVINEVVNYTIKSRLALGYSYTEKNIEYIKKNVFPLGYLYNSIPHSDWPMFKNNLTKLIKEIDEKE